MPKTTTSSGLETPENTSEQTLDGDNIEVLDDIEILPDPQPDRSRNGLRFAAVAVALVSLVIAGLIVITNTDIDTVKVEVGTDKAAGASGNGKTAEVRGRSQKPKTQSATPPGTPETITTPENKTSDSTTLATVANSEVGPTHSPDDHTGLVWNSSPSTLTLRSGRSSTLTVRASNTSTWTMTVDTNWCTPPALVPTPGSNLPPTESRMCTSEIRPVDLIAGSAYERPISVYATNGGGPDGDPLTSGTYIATVAGMNISVTVTS